MRPSLWTAARRFAIIIGACGAALALAIGCYALAVVVATKTGVAATTGTVTGLALHAPVTIARDDRDVPHIRATDEHDLFFAQGYATGSDRLFQMDITRRYVLGELAELLGPPLADVDATQRVLDARRMVERQWAGLDARAQAMLAAYADGVNAAAEREPTPPEYRALFATFRKWRPQDTFVAGTATVVDLSDSWNDIVARAHIRASLPAAVRDAFFPLTDAAYDVATAARTHVIVPALPPFPRAAIRRTVPHDATALWNGEPRTIVGSNEWVVGGRLTASGKPLLANDPHLTRGIPGVWHLVDLEAPGYHAAGATFAGVPGVILGHNAHLAWGSTNGTVAAMRVFDETFADDTHYRSGGITHEAVMREETIHVRFGADRIVRYATTSHGFVLERSGRLRHAIEWPAFANPRSPIAAFDGLARARDLDDARRALARYPGPTQNFVLAADDGRAAYYLAGDIPNDPRWARDTVHASETAAPLATIPFAALPHRDPSPDLFAVTANNLMYGREYGYRLSASFSPPYRAAEIVRALAQRKRYTSSDFVAVQNDDRSLPDLEFARSLAAALRAKHRDRDPAMRPLYDAIARFDGRIASDSPGATVVVMARTEALRAFAARLLPADAATAYLALGPAYPVMLQALRERAPGWLPDTFLLDALRNARDRAGGTTQLLRPYGEVFAVVPRHVLAAFGMTWWNGPTYRGRSGAFAPAVQGRTAGQSFRAVWDVGDWDAGGIAIPLGESGEPGSPHYADLADAWARRELAPLPWSAAAVARATRTTETLAP